MTKEFLQSITAANFEVLLLDLIDERFDLWCQPDGQIYTLSSELIGSGFLAEAGPGTRIQSGTEDFWQQWEQGWVFLVEKLNRLGLLGRLRINKVFWSYTTKSGRTFSNPKHITNANKFLARMYDRMANNLPQKHFIVFTNDELKAADEHKWGVGPYHYVDEYYINAISRLTGSLLSTAVEAISNPINFIGSGVLLQEIDKNALKFLSQRFLPVHYYRIRIRLALPLPIEEPFAQTYRVRNFSSSYPWSIWLLWALENRILTLGEYVCQTNDSIARTAVESDLSALACWKTYRESDRLDLAYAHAVHVLWVAFSRWDWLDTDMHTMLREALLRAVEDALPFSDRLHGQFDSVQALLAAPSPHQHLHNIPLIGTCALALAAKAVGHPASARLDTRVAQLFIAVLSLRKEGFTEGASYDGYVLCFVADWLSALAAAEREQIISHPAFSGLVEQVIELAVPGSVMDTAPLGDAEPVEMSFVWSALAKLQPLQPNARVAWALSQCDVARLRADALVAMAHFPAHPLEAPFVQSPNRLNYALVLRTGYAADDVAVAMGLSSSPMGHIQCDNGSVVLGSRGRWWLDDPGYQQYLQTSERKFTVGPTAHNAPVINGYAQAHKQPELLTARRLADSPDVQFALVDLTACYPAKAGVIRMRRAVWLVGNEHLIVCDEVAAVAASVAYHWHGHPALYWCLQDGAATLVSEDDPDRCLHVYSPQITLSPADLHRLPGSRGQQTLTATVFPPAGSLVWWVFSFAAERPGFRLTDKAFVVGDREVSIDERIEVAELRALARTDLFAVTASREGNLVKGRCVVSPEGDFCGELEYAFYLMVGGQKALVQWYTASPAVSFTVPDDAGEQRLEVMGFVREKLNPEKKMIRSAAVSK